MNYRLSNVNAVTKIALELSKLNSWLLLWITVFFSNEKSKICTYIIKTIAFCSQAKPARANINMFLWTSIAPKECLRKIFLVRLFPVLFIIKNDHRKLANTPFPVSHKINFYKPIFYKKLTIIRALLSIIKIKRTFFFLEQLSMYLSLGFYIYLNESTIKINVNVGKEHVKIASNRDHLFYYWPL